jgi:hypothetical protein
MRAIEASIGAAVIGAGSIASRAFAFAPDKTLHFQYTSGPQPVAKVA